MTAHQKRWLSRAVSAFRPRFRKIGYPLPRRITAAYAECSHAHWYGEAISLFVEGKLIHGVVKVDPKTRRGDKVLKVLAHELCHIAANAKVGRLDGHGLTFQDCETALCFEYPAPKHRTWMNKLRQQLGRLVQ